jgi:hypothetical protein
MSSMSRWWRGVAVGAMAVAVLGTPCAFAQVAFEAESVAVTHSGTGTTVQSDANTSGGTWVSLDAENTGSWFEFTTPSLSAGTYTLTMRYKAHASRGQLSTRVDDVVIGGTLEQYSASTAYPTATLGSVSFSASGTHKIRLAVTGKNSASSGYILSADSFTFTGVASTPTPTPTPTPSASTVSYEAEALAVAHSGVGTSVQSDTNTSGGQWISLNATGTGSWMEFTTPTVSAGTYSVRMRYKGHSNRGQLVLRVDGAQVGGTLDQYASPSTYPEFTFGNVSFGSAGSHKIRLQVTGKASASSGYTLSADRFTLAAGGGVPTPTPTPTPGGGATPTPTPRSSPVTSGWTQSSWTYSMHKPWDVSLSERFSYSNGVWTCWLFPDDEPFQPPPKEGGPRTEMRWNNDYTSGQRMWDSDIWVLSPTRSTVMQLFGGSESQTGYQIRSFEDGTLRRYTGDTLVTNAFERWINIKVAHNVGTHRVASYVNDVLVRTDDDRGPPSNVGAYYFKNGLYGCETGRCESRFRNTKEWRR